MIRRFRPAVVLLALALTLGSTAPVHAADPIDFNVILPLTGTGAFIGQSEAQVLKLVEKQVNAEGGIAGRPIRMVIADNQTNAQVDIQLANALIAKNVPFIIDGGPAVVCHAIAPLYVNGPLLYCLSPAFYPVKDGYAFAANAPSIDGMQTLLNYMRESGWTKIAMISATDTPGQEADAALRSLLEKPENRGMTMVAWEHFNPADLSVAAQIAKIKAAQPQAMFVWTTGTPNGTVLRGLNDAGIDIPILEPNANQFYAQMAQYKPFLPKQYFIFATAFSAYPNVPPGPTKPVIEKMQAEFKAAGLRPDLGASNSWDPAWILVSALRKVGPNATPRQLRDYILGLTNYAGIDGVYDFRGGNQRGMSGKYMLVARWDAAREDFVAVSRLGGVPLK